MKAEVLDFLVQSKRNAKAALKLMRKLLKKQGWTPTRITTDKLRSYHVAIRTLGLTAQHIDDRRANNRAENSHQPVRRPRTKTAAFQITGFGPTLSEHSIRRLQHLLCPAAFTQQIHVQTISKRRIQCMGKCECGRLKGNPCGPLRPNTINVTMPYDPIDHGSVRDSGSATELGLLVLRQYLLDLAPHWAGNLEVVDPLACVWWVQDASSRSEFRQTHSGKDASDYSTRLRFPDRV